MTLPEKAGRQPARPQRRQQRRALSKPVPFSPAEFRPPAPVEGRHG